MMKKRKGENQDLNIRKNGRKEKGQFFHIE